jgi:hypothetical protein
VKAAVGVDVVGTTPKLQPRLEQFAEENVSLITSLSSSYFDDIEKRGGGGPAQRGQGG